MNLKYPEAQARLPISTIQPQPLSSTKAEAIPTHTLERGVVSQPKHPRSIFSILATIYFTWPETAQVLKVINVRET